MNRPLIIAHRGASHEAPENTPAAFELAWRQGADAVETDLRLTADGVIVAIHDADGRRTLRDPRRIRDLPHAELQKLDAGGWKHPRWRGERVPSLREILARLPAGKQLVLELKEDLVDTLARELSAAPLERITLIAFDASVLAEAKRRLPACRALWLFNDYASLPSSRRGEDLVARVRQLHLDGVDLRHERRLNAALLVPLQAAKLQIFTYTINHSTPARRCAQLKIDGLTTDRPEKIRFWLQGLQSA